MGRLKEDTEIVIENSWYPGGGEEAATKTIAEWDLICSVVDEEYFWMRGRFTDTQEEPFVMFQREELEKFVQWLIDNELIDFSIVVKSTLGE